MPDNDVIATMPQPGIFMLRPNRPARRNAMSLPAIRNLHRTLDPVLEDSSLRAMVLTTAHSRHILWKNLDAASLDAAIELDKHAQLLGLMTDDFQEAAKAAIQNRNPAFRGQ